MMVSRLPRVVPTGTRTGLIHDLSWTGLAAPTTLWLRAKVSNLMAICDARRWSMTWQTVKSWDRNLYVHAGVCRSGSNACYIIGKEDHYARNCTLSNQNLNPQFQNRNPSSQLHAAQVKIEGPSLAQGRLEAPESQARIYAYTKGDVKAGTSSVVTGQTSVITYNALALLDSGVTHSFVLKEFAQKLGRRVDSLEHP
ncbi:hypothetical protein TIFTF001_038708 [Ficus carica]|uniref:Gag-pol polyprotein n=1 Tax=Ficus carica TaxID=3494 RepID=A0AA88JDB8_FICCA|nr:hypothetical protein TIFTF001_038708 [Ficus carica]